VLGELTAPLGDGQMFTWDTRALLELRLYSGHLAPRDDAAVLAGANRLLLETALGWDPDPLLRLMAMVPPDTERMRELSTRLKLSRADADRLAEWSEAPVIAPTLAITALDRLLYRHGAGPIIDRIRLSLVSARSRTDADAAALTEAAGHSRHLARAEGWERPVFPVSGSDLIAQGVEPGPALGARLSALEERWIDSNFTLDKQKLLAELD